MAPAVEELKIEPWHAFEALSYCPYRLFLDSALVHHQLGRYSFVTADPFGVLLCNGQMVWWESEVTAAPVVQGNALATLAGILREYRADNVANLPPFQGGAAGLFGYGLCHQLEELPHPSVQQLLTPDVAVGFYDWVYAFDHVAEQGWLISTGFPEQTPARKAQRALQRVQEIKELLQAQPTRRADRSRQTCCGDLRVRTVWHPLKLLSELYSNFDRDSLLAAVQRVVEYIHAGDCFQVNLAQQLLYPQRELAVSIYAKLRARNAATFGGYFDLGDAVVASASPERFLRVSADGEIETRPIKGTRPRGAQPLEDQANKKQLLQSNKDRAENVMIVDLLRNDLGRVAAYGSVRVARLCEVESYETVHHLVSVVTGKLAEGQGCVDLLRVAFPGGSVTGAPKIRAMQIITELERLARGAYCGSLGYLGFNGAMDSNILIRTFTVSQGCVVFGAGGGIVADSDPKSEYEETLHKAAGMLRAFA
jgi:para-aminobenzoate synthetase component 1